MKQVWFTTDLHIAASFRRAMQWCQGPDITLNDLTTAELIPYKLSSCPGHINRINHLCLAQAPSCDFSCCLHDLFLYFHLAAHVLCNLWSTKRPSLGDFKTNSERRSNNLFPCLVGFLCGNPRAGKVCPTEIPYKCSV